MSGDCQFSTFLVEETLFGVPVEKIQEVIRHLESTRVPLAPPMVRGLINLRGQIIAAVDVRRCLGLPERPAGQVPVHLIFRSEDGPLSLLVDEIGAVLELRASASGVTTEALPAGLREFVSRVYKLSDRLLLVLNTDRMLHGALNDGNAISGPAAGAPQC